MRIVILGGRDRRERDDYDIVNRLLDNLKARYPQLLIITAGCDRGVGKIINNRLAPAVKGGVPEIDYLEFSMRMTVSRDLPKIQITDLFLSRNATLEELGDEFHLFMEQRPMGVAEDLRQRCIKSGKPHALYYIDKSEPTYVNWPGGSMGELLGADKPYKGESV